ncbi:hypothetical protein SAMN04489735_107610 [Aneurinibacillus thermoaerophilus]|uniref:Uncharacterized protein n=1 Tax=Aneurinibacillus thermoaerophilus TaxID=143495 RepID=A0A1G8FPS9_ANETH|nr:hypothetical protein [Aneurinibacillus thermoaerophilus]SDH84145.1 hypothetical protein SAMN04489735_107610 [Aneurinibacillus thermoaerophilus]
MEELKFIELLKSVIKDELKPLYTRLDKYSEELAALQEGQEEIKSQLDAILLDINKLRSKSSFPQDEHNEMETIQRRLDYQLMRIARTEEELHLLKPEKQ